MQEPRKWLLTALVVLVPAQAWVSEGQSSSPSPAQQHFRKVEGRTEPHALPEHLVWETGLGALVRAATNETGEFSERQIAALSKYTLYMSTSDARRVVESARLILKRVDDIRQPLNDEHATGRSLGWTMAKRQETLKAAEREVLKGKQELQSQLSPPAFKALHRWIVQSSAGMVTYVPE